MRRLPSHDVGRGRACNAHDVLVRANYRASSESCQPQNPPRSQAPGGCGAGAISASLHVLPRVRQPPAGARAPSSLDRSDP